VHIKNMDIFFHQTIYFSNKPNTNVLLNPIKQNSKSRSRGPDPQKRVGGLGPCEPPVPLPMMTAQVLFGGAWEQLMCPLVRQCIAFSRKPEVVQETLQCDPCGGCKCKLASTNPN